MRHPDSTHFGGRLCILGGLAVAIVVVLPVASTASTSGGSNLTTLFGGSSDSAGFIATSGTGTAGPPGGGSAGTIVAAGTKVAPGPMDTTISPEEFLNPGYCPPVQIRAGTESLVLYDKGHDGDQDFIRFQGSISDTARECHALTPTTLSIKVGIAGRIVAGPKGTAGKVAATLRVAVVKQHDGTVLYSAPTRVLATIGPPDFAADFHQVIDNISVTVGPDDRDLIIFVGYDEGPPKPKSAGDAPTQ